MSSAASDQTSRALVTTSFGLDLYAGDTILGLLTDKTIMKKTDKDNNNNDGCGNENTVPAPPPEGNTSSTSIVMSIGTIISNNSSIPKDEDYQTEFDQNGFSMAPARVLWSNKINKRDLDVKQRYVLLNRKLKLGQKVVNLRDHTGIVVGSSATGILQLIHSTDIVTNDVALSSLSPVTPFFYGVQIQYLGWIGLITGVDRLFETSTNGVVTSKVFVKERNKKLHSGDDDDDEDDDDDDDEDGDEIIVTREYPFYKKYKELACYTSFANSFTSADKTVMRELSIKVQWLGPIPSIQALPHPPSATVASFNFYRIKAFHIQLSQYIYAGKAGLCFYKPQPKDNVIKYKDWESKLQSLVHQNQAGEKEEETKPTCFDDTIKNVCLSKISFKPAPSNTDNNNNNDNAGGGRNVHDASDEPETKILKVSEQSQGQSSSSHLPEIVQVVIQRNSYLIKWDHCPIPQQHFGDELQPFLSRTSSSLDEKEKNDKGESFANVISPYIYVQKRRSSSSANSQHNKKSYGVIIGSVKQDGIDKYKVIWLSINTANTTIEHSSPTIEHSLDVVRHPTYNQLTTGRHVYLKTSLKAEKLEQYQSSGFLYGTIKTINRSFFGKILVYCVKDKTDKWLWPFQLELIPYTFGKRTASTATAALGMGMETD